MEFKNHKNESIFIIDDDEDLCRLLEHKLSLAGYDVCFAVDGPSGIKRVRKNQPALLLLDWMMPEMDGLEVLKKLKKNPKTKQIPVVMLTAKGMMRNVETAMDEGAVDYITKPFQFNELLILIRRNL